MAFEHCPKTRICPFYQNWSEKTGEDSTFVITETYGISSNRHDCRALIAVKFPYTGVPVADELKRQLKDPDGLRTKMASCPLNQLNTPGFLDILIEHLVKEQGGKRHG